MNRDMTDDAWIEKWEIFLGTMEGICRRKRDFLSEDESRVARLDALLKILSHTLALLRDELNPDTLKQILIATAKQAGSRQIIVITGAEMTYVNEHFEPSRLEGVEEADGGVEAGKTVKDSIEKFFGFIPRSKSIIHALNEILSLVRGA